MLRSSSTLDFAVKKVKYFEKKTCGKRSNPLEKVTYFVRNPW